MPPQTTLWPLDPHTKGKHLVLRHYMDAWLPIMSTSNGRVLFIDAFAGPGQYSGGEDGSPVIALRALTEHDALSRMKNEIIYLFIEKNTNRFKHLEGVLEQIKPNIPSNCSYHIHNASFDEALTEVLNDIDEQNRSLAPSFVMIDPFGVSETPMKTINRILSNPKSEVYISFMERDINRFRLHPHFASNLDDLFGCTEWRDGSVIKDKKTRREFDFDLYKSQLKRAGAKYVLHFELYEGQELIYAIYFGTQNLEGCDKMKRAVWKVAPSGDYRFRGGQDLQFTLGEELLDLAPLRMQLKNKYAFRDWVRIEDIVDFAKSDETGFHSGHLKLKTLNPMEKDGEIEVKNGTRKKKGTYPPGTILRFL